MSLFSDRLKELRKSKGVTQKVMAEYLGMVERAYQDYEYGKLEPNHEKTIKLADYFDVSTDYLLGRDEKYWLDENGHLTVNIPPDFINWNHEEILQYYKERREQAVKERDSE